MTVLLELWGMFNKCQLISLGTLDSNGFKFSDEGEVLRVSKNSLVVMKEKKINPFYILQSSIVTGGAPVSLPEDPNLDTTRL